MQDGSVLNPSYLEPGVPSLAFKHFYDVLKETTGFNPDFLKHIYPPESIFTKCLLTAYRAFIPREYIFKKHCLK